MQQQKQTWNRNISGKDFPPFPFVKDQFLGLYEKYETNGIMFSYQKKKFGIMFRTVEDGG